MKLDERVHALVEKGVKIQAPHSIALGPEVDPDRISGEGVILHAGCRIFGAGTLICAGAELGREAPVTLENCQIGPEVQLKGGYFKDAVFLKRSGMGSGAQVREGTILEEEASGAHTVGLKQTILFPFVTLGSLINFCDCLMTGGTSRKDHSEVGSSYVHFNFTPNQDKATASLMGNVPDGVMLNQRPVFLGGQGGLVGPCRLAFGTVIAAGCIYRKDELRPNRLLIDGIGRSGNMPFETGFYRSIKRIVQNNILYITNLMALRAWYGVVRREFISDAFPDALWGGLMEKVYMGIAERITRLDALAQKLPESARIYREQAGENASAALLAQKAQLHERSAELSQLFLNLKNETGDAAKAAAFISVIQSHIQEKGKDYIAVIKSLNDEEASLGTQWLQGMVDAHSGAAFALLPAFGFKAA
ncbi:MAG: protein GlmU [Desulfobacterales bacterium]|jgi:UDP-N-acetylglucosamine/UDP-N-acetylgalactosamine diphosphorylase|nr:protein GlmU [Desulfobacterales bacterium]